MLNNDEKILEFLEGLKTKINEISSLIDWMEMHLENNTQERKINAIKGARKRWDKDFSDLNS